LNEHLSSSTLNSLADGELAGDELVLVNQHLAACCQCTSSALVQSLLKAATGRAGQRYVASPELRERLTRLAAQEASYPQAAPAERPLRQRRGVRAYGWMTAAAVLLVCAVLFGVQQNTRRTAAESFEVASLVTEVCDQHIATLAANAPPEVISSDRHTVKPWFQGKLPFSFNLPQDLPGDTTLLGANLSYLHGQPTAQLLYSIGKHRVSVFVQQRMGAASSGRVQADHAGFHVATFRTEDIEAVAVSDVDPARLESLLGQIEQAQVSAQGSSK
jgi:anti-sigma factor RsiW